MSDLHSTVRHFSPEKVSALRAWVRERLDEHRARKSTAPPDPAPRFDAVFQEGTAWLDLLSYDDSWDDAR
jgi:hypothetical protein